MATQLIQRLALGSFLIALTAAFLIASDWQQRKVGGQRIPRVAILVYASQPVLLQGVEGALDALKDNGFVEGQSLILRQYNAEGDMATVNAIARQITDGQFEVVITFSTPAMQAVAKANSRGKATHVFGLVADPFSAGVGLRRDAPLEHPRHLVGTGLPFPSLNPFASRSDVFPVSNLSGWHGIQASPIRLRMWLKDGRSPGS